MRKVFIALGFIAASCGEDRGASKAADVVKVPRGTLKAGCDPNQVDDCRGSLPLRTETARSFEIDRTEVTVGAYARCFEAGPCRDAAKVVVAHDKSSRPDHIPIRLEPEPLTHDAVERDLPMWDVSAIEARAYCQWVGRRLPTEVEWERAARGEDGRPYPWGSEPPDCARVTYVDCRRGTGDDVEDIVRPVGSLPKSASPYGVLDMVGNVQEWTELASGDVSRAVALGGAIRMPLTTQPSAFVLGRRAVADARSRNGGSMPGEVGFRCARSLESR